MLHLWNTIRGSCDRTPDLALVSFILDLCFRVEWPEVSLGGGCLELLAQEECDIMLGINSFTKGPVSSHLIFSYSWYFSLFAHPTCGRFMVVLHSEFRRTHPKSAWVFLQILTIQIKTKEKFRFLQFYFARLESHLCVGSPDGATAGASCGISPQWQTVSLFVVATWSELGQCMKWAGTVPMAANWRDVQGFSIIPWPSRAFRIARAIRRALCISDCLLSFPENLPLVIALVSAPHASLTTQIAPFIINKENSKSFSHVPECGNENE